MITPNFLYNNFITTEDFEICWTLFTCQTLLKFLKLKNNAYSDNQILHSNHN